MGFILKGSHEDFVDMFGQYASEQEIGQMEVSAVRDSYDDEYPEIWLFANFVEEGLDRIRSGEDLKISYQTFWSELEEDGFTRV